MDGGGVRLCVEGARLSRRLGWAERGPLFVIVKAPDVIWESKRVKYSLVPSWNDQLVAEGGLVARLEVAVVSVGLWRKFVVGKGSLDLTVLAQSANEAFCIELECGEGICGDLWLSAQLLTDSRAAA